jgi:hypothetical protein
MSKHRSPPHPEKLRFYLHPWGPSENAIDIDLDGEKLIGNFGYWNGSRVPTSEEWNAFRVQLDQLGFWKWKGRYGPTEGPPICDGTPWSIWVRWGDRVVRSSGDGEFPQKFTSLERAIKRLIGKQG